MGRIFPLDEKIDTAYFNYEWESQFWTKDCDMEGFEFPDLRFSSPNQGHNSKRMNQKGAISTI